MNREKGLEGMQTGDSTFGGIFHFIDAVFDYKLRGPRQRFSNYSGPRTFQRAKSFLRKINQCLPSRESIFFIDFPILLRHQAAVG